MKINISTKVYILLLLVTIHLATACRTKVPSAHAEQARATSIPKKFKSAIPDSVLAKIEEKGDALNYIESLDKLENIGDVLSVGITEVEPKKQNIIQRLFSGNGKVKYKPTYNITVKDKSEVVDKSKVKEEMTAKAGGVVSNGNGNVITPVLVPESAGWRSWWLLLLLIPASYLVWKFRPKLPFLP